MSRLRASLAPTPIDHDIQIHLDRAAREIEDAIARLGSSGLGRAQSRRTQDDLRIALQSVQRVAYIRPPTPPHETYEDWKARRQRQSKPPKAQPDVIEESGDEEVVDE
jgi:hypothetical protein